jgi:hypothetical protein
LGQGHLQRGYDGRTYLLHFAISTKQNACLC